MTMDEVIAAPALDVATATVEELIQACDAGSDEACAELDRRGVEPPMEEPGPAPIERNDQPVLALLKANEVRLAAADVKAELATRQLTIRDALADERAGVVKIIDLLTAQRGWGESKARHTLAPLRIREQKRVRELTARQCLEIIAAVEFAPSAYRSAVQMLDEPFLSILLAGIDEMHMANMAGAETWFTTRAIARRVGAENPGTGVRLACLRKHGYVEMRRRSPTVWRVTDAGENAVAERLDHAAA